MTPDINIQYLLKKYIDNNCTEAEIKLLLQHFSIDNNEALLKETIEQHLENTDVAVEPQWKNYIQSAYNNIGNAINATAENIPNAKVIFIKKWQRIAVAAMVLLIAGSYLLFQQLHNNNSLATNAVTDILPGHYGATLQLSNGKKITLDSLANGFVTSDNNLQVIKKDGTISYEGKAEQVVYNDISTDKGRQWQLTLPDETKVWLNAASSIHYPLSFTGNERVVEITGEAYFEVAKNPLKPFRVKVNNAIVEVLGTHFNINAYNDEGAIKTTLAEGAVKVLQNNKTITLKPGQQARIEQNNMTLVENADVEEATAWKDGQFKFNGTDIETIMRQVSRWYNVPTIVYEKKVAGSFVGKIPRDVPVSKLFELLQLTKQVHFKIEKDKIIVSE